MTPQRRLEYRVQRRPPPKRPLSLPSRVVRPNSPLSPRRRPRCVLRNTSAITIAAPSVVPAVAPRALFLTPIDARQNKRESRKNNNNHPPPLCGWPRYPPRSQPGSAAQLPPPASPQGRRLTSVPPFVPGLGQPGAGSDRAASSSSSAGAGRPARFRPEQADAVAPRSWTPPPRGRPPAYFPATMIPVRKTISNQSMKRTIHKAS